MNLEQYITLENGVYIVDAEKHNKENDIQIENGDIFHCILDRCKCVVKAFEKVKGDTLFELHIIKKTAKI